MSKLLSPLPPPDTQPLLILMEFAMYGSLKDYLKQLKAGRLAPLHPSGVRTLAQGSGGAGQCLCPCHSLYPATPHAGAPSSAVTGSQRDPHSGRDTRRSSQRDSGSPCDPYTDPSVAAHAARLLRLLESDYYHQSHDRRGQDSDSDSANSDNVSVDDRNMCAYHLHSDLKDSPYQYYSRTQHAMSDYYNTYYNSLPRNRGEVGVATAGGVGVTATGGVGVATAGGVGVAATGEVGVATAGGVGVATTGGAGVATSGGVGVATAAETPGSNAPLLSYTNVTCGDADPSCHCSDGSCDCSDCSECGNTGYRNVCIYCSAGQEQGSGGRVDEGAGGVGRSLCPDMGVMQGKLSYFEVLDYACQIARGMEHLENMKVRWFCDSLSLDLSLTCSLYLTSVSYSLPI